MLVGEAPGENEVARRAPFVGASGACLDDMLRKAGIMRSECFITNVCRERPPGNDIEQWAPKAKSRAGPNFVPLLGKLVHPHVEAGWKLLKQEINLVKPALVIAFGNIALWSLTGKTGIKKWRGSYLHNSFVPEIGFSTPQSMIVPTYHPAYVMRDWSVREACILDLKRGKKWEGGEVSPPSYTFVTRPSFSQAMEWISDAQKRVEQGRTKLAVDVETRQGQIACVGVGLSRTEAWCIPFLCVERRQGYWLPDEEYAITLALKRLLTHPNALCIGQNFIYDTQYFIRQWGYAPNFHRDTMLGHHSCFSTLPKGLDFLASMYCEWHVYWKDESKDWDPKVGEDQLWVYNCKDDVVTYEVDEEIQEAVDALGLRQAHNFQQEMFWPVLQTMVRGVRVDQARRSTLAKELSQAVDTRNKWLESILGFPVNIKSPKQMKDLFYEVLAQKKIFNRATGEVTTNDAALEKIGLREPILRPLVSAIQELRSLGVFLGTFVEAQLDSDSRMRCSYNLAGTGTYRLSSGENAFGSGTNLQNIPSGDEDGGLLPNIRKIFVPDEGYTFFEGDLSKADAQVVAWDAGAPILKQIFNEGLDLHAENAKMLNISYAMAKRWVHGTNYGGQPPTLSQSCGITRHQAEQMQMRWFSIHPEIKDWQDRIKGEVQSRRFVQNAWGYRWHIFDRIEGILPEALAWIGQSTVAIYINKIWHRIYLELPDVQILLQVHDSLPGQFPSHLRSQSLSSIAKVAATTVIPYPDPLVIPFKIKTSELSWGDCE